jgi:neutral ceramidase
MDRNVMTEQADTWRAGVASVKITPAEPMWLAGWAVRQEPARGILSDLFATALILEDRAGEKLIVVSVDLIAMPRELCDAIARRVQTNAAVPRDRFVFAASHTHCGPEIRPDKVLFFNIPEEYANKIEPLVIRLEEQLAGVILSAMENLEPVQLFARKTAATFAHNRRANDNDLDHEVPVLDVVKANGARKAVVFGYACHNLTMPPEDLRYCADFSGFARDDIERANPGAKALFITGCAADQNPQPRGSEDLARQHGKELGSAVIESLKGDGMKVEPVIQAAMQDVTLEMQPVSQQWIDESLASNDPPRRVKAQFLKNEITRGKVLKQNYPAPMQAIKLGEQILLIAMSGEPVVEWAQRFRREFAGPLVWVAGYCNDMYGYIPTRKIQAEGGYEGGRANLWSALPTPWTDDVEDRVAGAIKGIVEKLNQQTEKS